ncbi:MAG: hypothetical protein O7E53_00690, partial [Alphaproteobacteria bacterium]|nr:hypothetical protein [Alphaproteobacteria bacterium]
AGHDGVRHVPYRRLSWWKFQPLFSALLIGQTRCTTSTPPHPLRPGANAPEPGIGYEAAVSANSIIPPSVSPRSYAASNM